MDILRIKNSLTQEWEDVAALVGPTGKSAYQIAVDHGYEGTEEEWLESLKADAPVQSVNEKIGQVVLTADDVGALPDDTYLFSGDYNDLRNKPTIPAPYELPTASTTQLGGVKVDGTTITINNGIISSVGGGQSGAVYSVNGKIGAVVLNASDVGALPNTTIIPAVPSNVSAFTNDSNYQTAADVQASIINKVNQSDLSSVAFSGDYEDLVNTPTIPTPYVLPQATTSILGGVKVDGTTIVANNGVISAIGGGGGGGGAVYSVNGQVGTVVLTATDVGALPNDTVLFDGNYNSLTNKPTLFDGDYNSLTNKPNLNLYQTKAEAFSGDYNDLRNKPAVVSYSAGSGIKIENGVISLNISSAEEVSF